MAKFKGLGTTLTDMKCVYAEIQCQLNSANDCCYLVQKLYFLIFLA